MWRREDKGQNGTRKVVEETGIPWIMPDHVREDCGAPATCTVPLSACCVFTSGPRCDVDAVLTCPFCFHGHFHCTVYTSLATFSFRQERLTVWSQKTDKVTLPANPRILLTGHYTVVIRSGLSQQTV